MIDERAEILNLPVGGFDTMREMLADLKERDFPCRVAIPTNLLVDARSRDELIAYLGGLWDGISPDTYLTDGVTDDRLYLGDGRSLASIEDGSDLWDDDCSTTEARKEIP